MRDTTRRDVLRSTAAVGAAALGLGGAVDEAAAETTREPPAEVTVSFDEDRIREYQPDLVLQGVDPQPSAWHALHAEHADKGLNAVYGFAKYPYQEGVSDHDSHLGDHEPLIVWYDAATGETERVDYAAYHWYRAKARGSTLEYATDAGKRPVFAVDPDYHHYYRTSADAPSELIETANLLETIDGWLANGFDESLAPSQPYDPWAMFSRDSWRRESARGPFERMFQAIWFNLGVAGASETSDLGRVDPW